jgi:hypothetical protein
VHKVALVETLQRVRHGEEHAQARARVRAGHACVGKQAVQAAVRAVHHDGFAQTAALHQVLAHGLGERLQLVSLTDRLSFL